MKRRDFLSVSAAMGSVCVLPLAQAHHGWSSFDQDRPIYLEGKVVKVAWQNPHVELDLEVSPLTRVPPDLVQRSVPAQTAPVDGKALYARAVLPNRKDKVWELELAPLTRMQAWNIAQIKPGAAVSVVGFTLTAEKGEAVVRVEYLFVDGKAYGLRSGPA